VKKKLLLIFISWVVPFLVLAQAGDTTSVRADTVKPVRQQPRVDTSRPVIAPVSDSVLPVDSTPAMDSVAYRDSVANSAAALRKLDLFQDALKSHPYYNFFGKPVKLVILERKPEGSEVFFYLLLALFFYYALVRIIFYKYHSDLFRLFFRATMRQQQLREQLLQTPLPSLLLNILFVMTASLYAGLMARYNNLLPGTDFWLLCLYCLVALIAIYIGKYMVLKMIGWILRINRATDVYLFVVFMVNKMVGIFLLPVLLLMAFPIPGLLPVVITLSLFVLAVLLGYRFLVSYRLIRTEIKVNPFHFFIYLCAFEIAPLLLIYKVLLTFVGRTI
jgi:hypothetical protein